MANWEMNVDHEGSARTWHMIGEVMGTIHRGSHENPAPYLALHEVLTGDVISENNSDAFVLGYYAAFRPRK